MNLTISKHLSDELFDLHGLVGKAAFNAAYGSFTDRNPYAGKMVTCPLCHRRRRENALLPCCNAKQSGFEPKGSPAVVTVRQAVGSAPFAKRRKHPHLNARKNQAHEIRLVMESNEPVLSTSPVGTVGMRARDYAVQVIDSQGMPPKFRSPRIGKTSVADAASLSNELVKFIVELKKDSPSEARAVSTLIARGRTNVVYRHEPVN